MEQWTQVECFEHYEVSSLGRIKRVDEDGNERILKGGLDPDGYRTILLYPLPTGKRKNVRLHRLIAKHFIPNPDNLPQINHINGIKDDNRIENLEWVSAQRNVKHSIETGLRNDEIRNKPVARLDIATRKVLETYPSIKAAQEAGFNRNNVGAVCRKEYGRKTHKGFVWRFVDDLETCND